MKQNRCPTCSRRIIGDRRCSTCGIPINSRRDRNNDETSTPGRIVLFDPGAEFLNAYHACATS